MVGASRVTGPDGKTWTVRRRWLPWRRALSLRSLFHSTPDGDQPAQEPSNDETPNRPGNIVLTVVLGTIGMVIWVVITAGKAVLILLAATLAITMSLADLILQLLVLPFVLLARTFGVMRWPVQVERQRQFVRTEFADGFDAAAALRDDLTTQIRRGELVAEPVTPS